LKLKGLILFIFFIFLSALLIWGWRNIYISECQNSGICKNDSILNSSPTLNTRERLLQKLNKIGMDEMPEKILMLALKSEEVLEVYLEENNQLKFLAQYPFTAFSGKLGPKLKEGDRQIPEGIYKIEYLNPNSKFHLSMKINYPNKFDQKMAKRDNRTGLGGDIFIHGRDQSIGCIAIGDEAIEELYLLAEMTLKRGIKVIICPKDFRKNSSRPKISTINWEDKLYNLLEEEINFLFP
tara:strand:+ start:303995 stop:304708 length:714 start_codon:yes stop_codon:yes gene_type:complete